MGKLEVRGHKDLIIGIDTPDDAGVFRISSDTALVQTLDFLTPVTNSPYEFGQIAAANSLSDIYAMGARPVTVMNIVCFPGDELGEDVLEKVLIGGMDKVHEAGATLLGGHSIDDAEFKYGLSVTGVVHPDKVVTNCGACSGDVLILTKPLGTGIVATAIKAGLAEDRIVSQAVGIMAMLNKKSAAVMAGYKVNACTDITGFGLAGHLAEMARGGKKRFVLFSDQVPLIEGAYDFAMMGMVPAGAHRNRKFCESMVSVEEKVDRALQDIIFDPQTSGGLVVSVDKQDADNCLKEMKDNGVNARIVGSVAAEDTCGFLEII